MLMSLDGKISNGASDNLDVDKDWKNIEGLKEGLYQYYDIEQTTDLFSLITGKVMAKIGVNEKTVMPNKTEVTFIIIDNKPHLTENGIRYFSHLSKETIIVTTNKNYSNYNYSNVSIIYYENNIDFLDLFICLKRDYDATNVTIQSGGTLNGLFLRERLIDYVNIVIAPVLVGGKDTPTLIDGLTILNEKELDKLGILKLDECRVLEGSYINVKYKVIK